MLRASMLLILALPAFAAAPVLPATLPDGPAYSDDGQLKFPENYRQWIFLSAGVDMSYNPGAQTAAHPVFDNVFVNPSAWRAFQETGTWPDKTMLVLENRGGESGHSINVRGTTQSADVVGLEVHVKDANGPQHGWGFFSFDNPRFAKLTPRTASCYSCHEAHAAVDTTFVQFYPTLYGLAERKGTLSAGYRKDVSTRAED